jgi:hypothetical protein
MLPHYSEVSGSWEPVTEGLIEPTGIPLTADPVEVLALEPTVEVEVPERLLDPETGRPSKERIRQLYAGQPLWDHDQVTDDLTPAVSSNTTPK